MRKISAADKCKCLRLIRVIRVYPRREKSEFGGAMAWNERVLKYEKLTERVIGIFYEVYNELGFGFLESVYREAMLLALRQAGLQVAKEVPIDVYFRGQLIGKFFVDLWVEAVLLLELKSCRCLDSAHEAQLLNELRATDAEVGLLLNFGPKPDFKRLVFDNSRKRRLSQNKEENFAADERG
jgi:GxxExxY protein